MGPDEGAEDAMRLDEDTAAEVLARAVDGVRPPTPRLVAGATRRGRRLRARRRAGTAAAACVAAGAVTAVSLWGGAPGPGGVEPRSPTGRTDGGPGPVRVPDFSAYPSTAEAVPPGKERISARATALALKETLPWDLESSQYAGRSQAGKWLGVVPYDTSARLRVTGRGTDGEVRVDFQAQFYAQMDDGTDGSPRAGLEKWYSCARFPERDRVRRCEVARLADGSVLLTYEKRSGDRSSRHADLLQADGHRVAVGAEAGAGGEPPLTLGALRGVVTSHRWRLFVDPEVNERAKALKPFQALEG